MGVIAERLGAERIPRTRVALRAYFRDLRPGAREQLRRRWCSSSAPMRGGNPMLAGAHQVVIQAAIGPCPAGRGHARPPAAVAGAAGGGRARGAGAHGRAASWRVAAATQARARCAQVPV